MKITLAEIPQTVKKIAPSIRARTLLLLVGPMGSGKTTFVRELVRELGGQLAVSPTFAVHNEYQLSKYRFHHFDLYRLNTEDELDSAGLWDSLAEPNAVVAIEWADRIDNSLWPKGWQILRLEF